MYVFIYLCFVFQNPVLGVRHVRLSSTPIWEPLGLQFNHSSLLICFTVEIEAGLRTPAQICEALNQGLARVRPGMRLAEWNQRLQTGKLNLQRNQSLLANEPTLLTWLEGPGLERGPNQAWQASDLWGEPTLPTEPAPSLIMTGSPEIPKQGRFWPERQTYQLGLLSPSSQWEAKIDMSGMPFNRFYRDDPINAAFAEHLAVQMADLIARPPLFRAWGLQLFTQVRDAGVVQWIKPPEITMTLSLRLDPFWQTYFLPRTRLVVNRELVKISDVEGLRAHRFDPYIILTTRPCLNREQSMFKPPFMLGSDLIMAENLLRPATRALSCLALIEPEGSKFQLVHQPILRLENIQGLSSWISLTLMDADNARIPCGPDTKIWIELASF